jgi:hypothetical protein
MPKTLLSHAEILELDQSLMEAYSSFRTMRARSAVAQLIHYPSVPSELTESLVIHCAQLFLEMGGTQNLAVAFVMSFLNNLMREDTWK